MITFRVLLVSFVLLLIPAGCAEPPGSVSLGWVRRGDFHLRGKPGDEVILEYESTPGGDDLAQFYGPDGRRLHAVPLPAGRGGRLRFELDAGAGDYRLVTGSGHRCRVTTDAAGLVCQPETVFPSLFQRDGEGGPYVFRVAEGERPSIIATNQNDFEGSAARLALFDPEGAPAGSLLFAELSEETLWAKLGASQAEAVGYRSRADTMNVPLYRILFDTLRVRQATAAGGEAAESAAEDTSGAAPPAAGFWRIEAGVTARRADDIGFWLEGTENLVAPTPERWFVPERPAVTVSVEADARRVKGPAGELGVVWDWPSSQKEARRAFLALGVHADKHFLPQAYLEPENDDADPQHARAAGFHFDEWAYRMDPTADPELALTSLMVIHRPADWASGRPEEFAEFAEEAIARNAALPGVRPERLYWQLMNEPDHTMRPAAYADLFRLVGERLARSPDSLARTARLGGPAIGNAQGEPGILDFDWIRELVRAADPYLDFIVWNEYRLPRLEETWRYADLVRETRAIDRRYDSDGRDEEIVIGATNMKGGVVLHNQRQDGFYNALWWASVVVNAFSTADVRILNYFYLIDEGSRRKGLLFQDGRWKPAARMMALLTRSLEPEVVEATSDHSEVEVLAMRGEHAAEGRSDDVMLLVVNKMKRPVELEPLRARLPAGWRRVHEAAMLYAEGEDAPHEAGARDRETVYGTWSARRTMPPRSVLVVRLERR